MARLEFGGARYVRNYHLSVPHHELVLDEKKSLPLLPKERGRGEVAGSGLDDNLIIHGDNLKALKALLPHFAGKVKCIYIDPPYNTGNENWVYNDNVNSPRHKEWLGKVVDKEAQDRHDRWLSMMTPRLKLLRELLRDDGVIFISIDDNEVHHLRMLMDEIFGEINFISMFGWQKVYSPKNQSTHVSNDYEFVVCYSKNIEEAKINLLPRTSEMDERYKNPDNDPRGPWKPGDLVANEERKGGHYIIKSPITGKEFDAPQGKHWAYNQTNMTELLKDNRIWFGKDGNSFPSGKQFLSEVKQGRKASSLLLYKESGHTDEAKKEVKEIFSESEKIAFDTPKPTRLITNLIRLGAGANDIILDSFAGSGTTAHAVLALNKEDGGNRKFILVEQEDYADTITAERVRRVIKGVKTAKDENLKQGLGGSFTYYTLGKEFDIAKLLSGKNLPSYEDMAAYCFFTATGENIDRKKIDKKKNFVGSSSNYDVYLFYEPDVEKLKSKECALTLDWVESWKKPGARKRLVFAPVRYASQESMNDYGVEYCQLPYEIYRRTEERA